MTDYHTVYKRGEGESTQWEDIQRKLGNIPEKVRIILSSICTEV